MSLFGEIPLALLCLSPYHVLPILTLTQRSDAGLPKANSVRYNQPDGIYGPRALH